MEKLGQMRESLSNCKSCSSMEDTPSGASQLRRYHIESEICWDTKEQTSRCGWNQARPVCIKVWSHSVNNANFKVPPHIAAA